MPPQHPLRSHPLLLPWIPPRQNQLPGNLRTPFLNTSLLSRRSNQSQLLLSPRKQALKVITLSRPNITQPQSTERVLYRERMLELNCSFRETNHIVSVLWIIIIIFTVKKLLYDFIFLFACSFGMHFKAVSL